MIDLKQHLIERGMDPELYVVAYDYEEQSISFLLYNLSGQIVGYQKYRPGSEQKKKRNDEDLGRYYTFTSKHKSDDGTSFKDGVFGLEAILPPVRFTDRPLYIVEGVFKAAVLHRLGFDAIAVLTSHPKRLKSFLRIVKTVRPVVGIGDPDPAGEKLVRFVGAGFTSPKDLDEMSDLSIIKLLQGNT